MTRRLDIDGQDFDIIERFTLEQELYLAGLIRQFRLDRLPIIPGDDARRAGEALVDALCRHRMGRRILSVLLVPAGEVWTADEAKRTADYIRDHIEAVDDNALIILVTILAEALMDRGVLTASLNAGKEGTEP